MGKKVGTRRPWLVSSIIALPLSINLVDAQAYGGGSSLIRGKGRKSGGKMPPARTPSFTPPAV